MQNDTIKISIPNARQKLRIYFPRDPKGDFSLVFKSKTFKLQKAHLRLQSNFFKKQCTQQKDILQIKENFNIGNGINQQKYFQDIMSCFYGNKLQIPRGQVMNYYPILKFLQIQGPLAEIRKDMVQNIKQYDLFVLMKMAHKYSQQQIFQTCLIQLQKQGFQQIKYSITGFLQCDIQLFKLIIKTHNRKKTSQKGLSYKQVDQVIKQYVQQNQLPQEKYHQFKFQLIDKTKLTAQQYKQIFMDELAKNKSFKQSFINSNPNFRFTSNSLNQNAISNSINPLFDSFIDGNASVPTDLTIEMENIYQKKKNQQLQTQKTKLAQQLGKIRQNTLANHQATLALQRQLNDVKQKLKVRQNQDRQQKTIIAKMQMRTKKLENQNKQKDIQIKKLKEKLQKIQKSTALNSQQQIDQFSTSTIIPANLIGDLMKKNQPQSPPQNTIKKKQTEKLQQVLASLDEEELQQKYHSRISFDIQPVSIPKIMIPKLVDVLGTDGFSKKTCRLIYRRSDKHKSVGQNNCIRQRNELILLIKTGSGKYIGGFVKAKIFKNSQEYIQDNQAMIFQLNQGKRFMVKSSNASQAIYVSQYYLIGFGNDLMIATDCLDEASQCDWPSSYQKGGQGQNAEWFAGGNQFMIKQLQFYEVQQGQMQMVL